MPEILPAFSSQDRVEYLKLLEQKVKYQELLPHLHGWKFYKWARDYFESLNKVTLICAANQISKSSTQIRKHIHWATNPSLWPSLWRTQPSMFWYCYPTRDVAHIEFEKKWEKEFLPKGEFRHDHPIYGWKKELYHNRIFAIHWNSGVSTYFKTYAQNVQDLQTGTVYRLDLDEEPPEELMSELSLRLASTDGYMSAVFTPTIGQEFWRQAIEERGSKERYPDAFKRQVSMYDCLTYADGSKSPWSLAQIRRAENSCKNQNEIDRRVHGKFVVAEGLKYGTFHKLHNRKPGHPVPKSWSIWFGVDIGSGGEDNHPSAITVVAVSPDWKEGRVVDGWRGDGEVTTAGDVVVRAQAMSRLYSSPVIKYDFGCRDFFTIATEAGLPVAPAEKNHIIGEHVLNVLFKNKMLWIYDYPQLDPLCTELSMLKNATPKRQAKDDFVDSLRYAVASIPWDWSSITEEPASTEPKLSAEELRKQEELKNRRDWATEQEDKLLSIEEELASYNELMGNGEGDYNDGY